MALGDVVTIDLSATVDGEDVPNAAAEGLSHEVGSGRLIEGLDDALVGLSVDESRDFTASWRPVNTPGRMREVTVTVKSIKERELPEADDEFAQLASEFDTIDELRTSLRDQVSSQARPAGRADSQRHVRRLARSGRRAGAGGRRAGPIRQRHTQRAARPQPRRSQVRRGARRSKARRARSSRPRPAPPPRRTSSGSCCWTRWPTSWTVQVGQDDLTERLWRRLGNTASSRSSCSATCRRTTSCRRCSPTCGAGWPWRGGQAATVTDTDGNTVDTSEFFGSARGQATTRPTTKPTDGDESDEADAIDDEADDEAARRPRDEDRRRDAVSERAHFGGAGHQTAGRLVSVGAYRTRESR